MARKMAADKGLDLASIEGSGPAGRVIKADVEAAGEGKPAAAAAPAQAAAAPVSDEDERVPLSQMRKTIARRMSESKRTAPEFTVTVAVDATDLVETWEKLFAQMEAAKDEVKTSINHFIIRATALALMKVPEVNVSFAEDALILHKHAHVGFAVAIPGGLVVPVIRNAEQKSIRQIAVDSWQLVDKARNGKLQPADYSGGTFTVSNLGMFGVEHFTAIINQPEAAILAVGAAAREPAEYKGEIALRHRMHLTITADHRAVDGAIAARYMQALKQLLENPLLLLV
jgi:pyruvate dehydrogenase E2 component (dihydrolipoamide acetyltransferase)